MATHVFHGRRKWGHNYNILQVEDGGQRLQIAGWCADRIEGGDTLVLSSGLSPSTYKVDTIEHQSDPPDMFFAWCDYEGGRD